MSCLSRRLVGRIVVLAALALGGARVGTSGAEAAAKATKATKKARAKAPAGVDCKKDADCVAVLDDCCPCTQGGKQRAIPKKGEAAYERDRKSRCESIACIDVMSQDATCEQKPFCGAGICELGEPPAAAP